MKFTTDYSILGRVLLGAGALSFLPFVEAEFAQCVSGWEWSYNSKGQNPCEIAGSLQAPCLGFALYELAPLSQGSNYVTPQSDDAEQKKCGCNSIIYSLYAACSICQQNSTGIPLTWAYWSQFCDSVYVTEYPFDIPYNASVPHWTYVNYTDSSFDVTRAKAAGRDPEATPEVPPVVSLSSTTSSTPSDTPLGTNRLTVIADTPDSVTETASIPSPTSSGSSSGGDSPKTNVGVIAGGVVGGVIGLAGLAGLAFFFFKRRGGGGDAGNGLGPDQTTYPSTQNYEQPKLYNPADPSTFPSPVSGGDSSHSGGGYTTNQYQPGRYNGAAEI